LIEQLDNQPSAIKRLNKVTVPWHVHLIGEGATDVGGPGRDVFSQTCLELSKPVIGLFIPSPNMRRNQGESVLVPNPSPVEPGSLREKMYFYAGLLFSVCFISKLPQPFRFARFVWNSLTGRSVCIEDVYEIDLDFKQLMESIQQCEKDGIDSQTFSELFPNTFEIQNAAGDMVALILGGSSIRVTFERRLEFVQRSRRLRLKEFSVQLEWIRKGFNQFFVASVASILSPWELELLVCGPAEVELEQLTKNYQIDNSEHVQVLWRVLATFSTEEKMKFIQFGRGRMSLPPPRMSWESKLKIDFRTYDSKSDMEKLLPTAGTCSSRCTFRGITRRR
jgi:hypothetical protein